MDPRLHEARMGSKNQLVDGREHSIGIHRHQDNLRHFEHPHLGLEIQGRHHDSTHRRFYSNSQNCRQSVG